MLAAGERSRLANFFNLAETKFKMKPLVEHARLIQIIGRACGTLVRGISINHRHPVGSILLIVQTTTFADTGQVCFLRRVPHSTASCCIITACSNFI